MTLSAELKLQNYVLVYCVFRVSFSFHNYGSSIAYPVTCPFSMGTRRDLVAESWAIVESWVAFWPVRTRRVVWGMPSTPQELLQRFLSDSSCSGRWIPRYQHRSAVGCWLVSVNMTAKWFCHFIWKAHIGKRAIKWVLQCTYKLQSVAAPQCSPLYCITLQHNTELFCTAWQWTMICYLIFKKESLLVVGRQKLLKISAFVWNNFFASSF